MKISKHVQEAYDHFEKADMMLSSHKSDVNEYVFNCMKMEGQLISDIKEAENNIRKESIAINEKINQIENTKRHLLSARTNLDHAERVANRAYSELLFCLINIVQICIYFRFGFSKEIFRCLYGIIQPKKISSKRTY
jgi:hypothetical protein